MMRVVKGFGGLGLLLGLALAAPVAGAQKPDLHGTGAEPSEIVNHQTTKVMKDGSHLAGATVTVRGACTLASYSATEHELTMYVKAERTVGADETCFYTVKNRYGSSSSWIVVAYTDDEQKQVDANERKVGLAKLAQMQARAGKEWTVHFSDGTTTVYTFAGEAGAGMGSFTAPGGRHLNIAVTNDNNAALMDDDGCVRMGKLEQGRVRAGTSLGNCKPDGVWSATMK